MNEEGPRQTPWWRRFARAWTEIDPRALGMFRIAFGMLCVYDVLRRYQWIETFYSNTGVLSNHFSLFRPHSAYNFSFLFTFSNPEEVKVFFIVTIACLVMFTLGLFTKFFHVICMLCIISIHSRNVLLENGGDVVNNLWWLWTLWLPLGARFSLDALRKGLKAGRGERSVDLVKPLGTNQIPVRSLALFAILCQLSVIYFFNTFHKSGPAWMDGTALAYFFEQDRTASQFGQWVKEIIPMWLVKGLSWGTLVIEGFAPLLLLTPIFTKWARRVFILTLVLLHVSIWLLSDVGLFSPTMMVSYFLLLCAADLALIKRVFRRLAGPPIGVWYDGECGLSFFFARVGRCLDRLERVTWRGTGDDPAPEGWSGERLATERVQGIIVGDPSGRIWTGHRAVVRIISALPFGRLVSWVFLVPGLSHLAGWAHGHFSARRKSIGVWAGCAESAVEPPIVALAQPTTGAQRLLGRVGGTLSLVVLLFFMAATTYQNLVENPLMRKHFDVEQPNWSKRAVQYGRFFQGWSMFAPDPPKRDGHLVMDVELPDGTHVDPQTMKPPVMAAANFELMNWDQMWGSFSLRIATKRNVSYRAEFSKWLRNPNIRRLGFPKGQKVKGFKVYYIGDYSPAPGSGAEPKIYETQLIMEWPPPARRSD